MNWDKLLSNSRDYQNKSEVFSFHLYNRVDLSTDFEHDQISVVGSPALRRMQNKTQFFPLDQGDFVHTRLTHSYEVSLLSERIWNKCLQKIGNYKGGMLGRFETFCNETEYDTINEKLENSRSDISKIVSTAGLLHDIGNPPFGHQGETIIRNWFENWFTEEFGDDFVRNTTWTQDFINFEGNAQTLRLLINSMDNLDITSAVIGAVVKYPATADQIDNSMVSRKKAGCFSSEYSSFQGICKELSTYDEDTKQIFRHPLAYIVEAADDIAYCTADIEDAFSKGYFKLQSIADYCEKEIPELIKTIFNTDQKDIDGKYFGTTTVQGTTHSGIITSLKNKIDDMKEKQRDESDQVLVRKEELNLLHQWLEYIRILMIDACGYVFTAKYKDIMNGSMNESLLESNINHYAPLYIVLKNLMKDFVFDSPELSKLDIIAEKLLIGLLDDFSEYIKIIYSKNDGQINSKVTSYDKKTDEILDKKMITAKKCFNLIPTDLKTKYENAYKTAESNEDNLKALHLGCLAITDYISGMSDYVAKKTYEEIRGLA